MKFVARNKEIQDFREILERKWRTLIAIVGRRGVGKTRLIEKFKQEAEDFLILDYMGIKRLSKEEQLLRFQLKAQKDLGFEFNAQSFSDFFWDLSKKLKQSCNDGQKFLICIDEFAWIEQSAPTFSEEFGQLYDSLDGFPVIFVISSSATSWMYKNVFQTSGSLHAKVQKRIHLKPFSFLETAIFLREFNSQCDFPDHLKYYFATGGVARYLSKLKPNLTFEENLEEIFGERNKIGNEFDVLFYSTFENKKEVHKEIILTFLKKNKQTKQEIIDTIRKKHKIGQKPLATAIDDLLYSDLLIETEPLFLKKGKGMFQLSDLFCFFYLKQMEQQCSWTELFDNSALRGFAFETLCLLNLKDLKQEANLLELEYQAGEWRADSRKNKGNLKDAQIDLLLYNIPSKRFFIGECKCKNEPHYITQEEMFNMQNKKEQLSSYISQTKHWNTQVFQFLYFTVYGTSNHSVLSAKSVSLYEIYRKFFHL